MAPVLSGIKVLITGSTDGLGRLVATHLAFQDAEVLLHGRNHAKGSKLQEELVKLTNNDKISYYNGDYASLEEVKALGDQILNDLQRIDVLINNVGIGSGAFRKERIVSSDGLELRFAVNYLAHVLLTEMLLPIIPGGTGRIINVASVGQDPIDFSDPMMERGYDGFTAYKKSKTALIMYTFDLAERLKARDIKVNAIHPASLMNTKMVTESFGYSLTSVEQGAEAVENLIRTDTTGQYYDGKRLSKAISQAYDLKARLKLAELTRRHLGRFL